MLKKRIIFTLIYADGFFMQSRNFRLQKVGDIEWLDKNYKFHNLSFSIDELIILDASRNVKDLNKFSTIIRKIRENVFIPIAAGGGIRSESDAEILFNNGADKLVINTLLVEKPEVVKKLVKRYGSQSIIASIDYLDKSNEKKIFNNNGTSEIKYNLDDYISYLQKLEIGEIYFNSIEKDGTGFGYDVDYINYIKNLITMPLIIAGGAGNSSHLIEGLKIDGVNAVATANLFNFIGDALNLARIEIYKHNLNISNWV